jgi:cell division protease FtsH
MAKNLILWVVIALVLMSVFNSFGPRQAGPDRVEYSQFINDVKMGRVQKVIIEGRNIDGLLQTGERFKTYTPETDNRALIGDLLENGVAIEAKPPEQQSILMQIFISWFPMLLLIAVWIFFMRQMQGGGRLPGSTKRKKKLRNWSIFCATRQSFKSWAAKFRAAY